MHLLILTSNFPPPSPSHSLTKLVTTPTNRTVQLANRPKEGNVEGRDLAGGGTGTLVVVRSPWSSARASAASGGPRTAPGERRRSTTELALIAGRRRTGRVRRTTPRGRTCRSPSRRRLEGGGTSSHRPGAPSPAWPVESSPRGEVSPEQRDGGRPRCACCWAIAGAAVGNAAVCWSNGARSPPGNRAKGESCRRRRGGSCAVAGRGVLVLPARRWRRGAGGGHQQSLAGEVAVLPVSEGVTAGREFAVASVF